MTKKPSGLRNCTKFWVEITGLKILLGNIPTSLIPVTALRARLARRNSGGDLANIMSCIAFLLVYRQLFLNIITVVVMCTSNVTHRKYKVVCSLRVDQSTFV